jgi:hypothetical protein
MGATYVCDLCGKPIEDQRDRATVSALGDPRFKRREVHVPACLEVLDRIVEEVCNLRGVTWNMPEQEPTARDDLREQHREVHERWARWHDLDVAAKERIIIEALGDDSYPVSALAAKIGKQLDASVHYSGAYPILERLREAGEVQREAEPWRTTRTRWRYSRRRGMSGPIADLERAFNSDEQDGER